MGAGASAEMSKTDLQTVYEGMKDKLDPSQQEELTKLFQTSEDTAAMIETVNKMLNIDNLNHQVDHNNDNVVNDNDISSIEQQQKEALIDLYRLMDGPNWDKSTNWCTDRPLSEWWGVTTGKDENQNIVVTKLELTQALGSGTGNNLRGNLSEWKSIENLTNLGELNLNMNQLTGNLSE